MHLLCVLAHQEWKAARGSTIFHPYLGSFACMKNAAKGCLASTSNLWQEVNPSLFRKVWPKTNIWTSWNRNHGIQNWTDCIQIKTALNRNSRILVISKRHANEKKKVPTLWSGEIDIIPQNHHPKVTSPITSPPYLLPLLPSVFIIPLHCPPRGLPATGGRALLKSSMKKIEKG